MAALHFPCAIFKTHKKMDDYNASDMRCGDLTEEQLKRDFHLVDVSSKVDPYKLRALTFFNQPQSMFHGSRREGEQLSRQKCAEILFDEFRHLSNAFSFYGPYSHLIEKMITHMQYNNGLPFRDNALNAALKEQLYKDNTGNSTRVLIARAFTNFIDWEKGYFPAENQERLRRSVLAGRLPRFDRVEDSVNGMGITVHDTWATHIKVKSLMIDKNYYRATLHYKVQDHFGLDDDDISSALFSQFRFFRIWFVLQRYNEFAFKPFITDMEATIEINGARNEF